MAKIESQAREEDRSLPSLTATKMTFNELVNLFIQ